MRRGKEERTKLMERKNELTLMCGANYIRYQTNKGNLEDAFKDFEGICQRNGIDISNVDFACATLRDSADGELVSVGKGMKAEIPAWKKPQVSKKAPAAGLNGRTSLLRANFWR